MASETSQLPPILKTLDALFQTTGGTSQKDGECSTSGSNPLSAIVEPEAATEENLDGAGGSSIRLEDGLNSSQTNSASGKAFWLPRLHTGSKVFCALYGIGKR